jgi:ABC-type transport system involved in cytochrome bd biosynthesis fused ATPase/permease subunit
VKAEGRKQALQDWFLEQKNAGLSRWWNNAGGEQATATALREIAQAVGAHRHDDAHRDSQKLGMSSRVSDSLVEVLSAAQRRLEAQAIRCPDRYELKWVEDGDAKRLDELSGGRKVAVLLSLVLESDDPTPLVVDQPEDELDNRFLNETIIPALHRLKGKRQVIFATHNANIVVNGDADQVIVLEATARHGRIAEMGAIEDRPIRDAILRTLDGGEEAFRLRRVKYGF